MLRSIDVCLRALCVFRMHAIVGVRTACLRKHLFKYKVLRLRFGRAMAPKQRVWDAARLEQAACTAASEKAAAIKSCRGDVSRVTCKYLGRGSAPRARLSCIFAAFLAVPQVRWCGSGTWQIRFFAAGR